MNLFSSLRTFYLDNGFVIYALPRPGSSSVELQMGVRTGSIHEQEFLGCGLSHFLEHMLFQGCKGFSGRSGSDAIEQIGGAINAYTSYEHTLYYLKVPKNGLELGTKLLCSMVRFPELPEKRFLEEREVIQRECDLYFDSPGVRLFCKMMAALTPDHPARIPIIGLREKISTVTCEMAKAYHRRRYTPGRTFLVAVGDFDPDELHARIGELLGDWETGDLTEPVFPAIRPIPAPREIETVFADSRSRLDMALPVRSLSDTTKAELLCGVLCGSNTCRLPLKLTLEKDLALDVNADFESVGNFGIPIVSIEALPGKLDRAESALLKELESVASGGIGAGELAGEKSQRIAEQLRSFTNNSDIARAMLEGILLTGDPGAPARLLEELKQVTPESLSAFAADCLALNSRIVVRQRPAPPLHAARNAQMSRSSRVDFTLSNGVRVTALPEKEPELISFDALLPAGALTETPELRGASSLLSHCLLNGTKHHSEEKLGVALDRCGANVSFKAGLNSLSVSLSAPRSSFGRAFHLLTEILSEPAFAEEAFEREREHLLEKFRHRAMKPGKAAWEIAMASLFGSHPYAAGEHGKAEIIRNFPRKQAIPVWNSFLYPDHTVIGFAGAFKEQEVEKWSRELESALPWNTDGKILLPELPEKLKEAQRLERPVPREQTVVMKALATPPLREKNGEIFRILQLAENGMSSPLFRTVREENALAYSVHCRLQGGFHPGILAFTAATRPDAMDEVEKLFDQEIRRLGSRGISQAEFEQAKDMLLFHLAQLEDSPHTLLFALLLERYYGEGPDSWTRSIEELKCSTVQEVNAAIKPFFHDPVTVTVRAGKLKGTSL